MFKSLLGLCLTLVLITPAYSQVDANGCYILGQVFYGVKAEQLTGKTLAQTMKDMVQGTKDLTPQEQAVLRPFYTKKIKEIYQSKKSPQEIGEQFIEQCFSAHGDLSKLTGTDI